MVMNDLSESVECPDWKGIASMFFGIPTYIWSHDAMLTNRKAGIEYE